MYTSANWQRERERERERAMKRSHTILITNGSYDKEEPLWTASSKTIGVKLIASKQIYPASNYMGGYIYHVQNPTFIGIICKQP